MIWFFLFAALLVVVSAIREGFDRLEMRDGPSCSPQQEEWERQWSREWKG